MHGVGRAVLQARLEEYKAYTAATEAKAAARVAFDAEDREWKARRAVVPMPAPVPQDAMVAAHGAGAGTLRLLRPLGVPPLP